MVDIFFSVYRDMFRVRNADLGGDVLVPFGRSPKKYSLYLKRTYYYYDLSKNPRRAFYIFP